MRKRVNHKRNRSELEAPLIPLTATHNSSALFYLPLPIFHLIFGEYLDIYNLLRFDNAVLNHYDRALFLQNISDMVVKFYSSPIAQPKHFLSWLYKRHLRLLQFTLVMPKEGSGALDNKSFEIFPLNVSAMEKIMIIKSSSFKPLPAMVDVLKKCSKLKTIVLKDESPDMAELFDSPTLCSKLEEVNIDRCCTGESLSKLARFSPNLHSITFDHNASITEFKLIEFIKQRGSRLKSMSLRQVEQTTSSNVPKFIAEFCINMKFLSGNVDISDMELIEFGKRCPMLTHLCTFTETRWTDAGVMALVDGCRQLTSLYIDNHPGNPGITDLALLMVTQLCKHLRVLKLSHLPALTDMSLSIVGSNCTSLRSLDLKSLNVSSVGLRTLCASTALKYMEGVMLDSLNICDDIIIELVKNTKATLRMLHIVNCNVTDVSMLNISNNCFHLTYLTLKELPRVSNPEYIAQILRKNRRLITLTCSSVNSQNSICNDYGKLVPSLLSLVDENLMYNPF